MSGELNPNDHQQEERADFAKALAVELDGAVSDGKFGAEITLKGETVDVNTVSGRIIVTANSDGTYSMDSGPSHISKNAVIQQLAGK